MNALKLLAAGAAAGMILIAFRDLEEGRWLAPARSAPTNRLDDETEPVLGYDGMDQETLLDWLDDADLDRATLRRMQRYEAAHRARRPVLDAIEDYLG